MVSIKSINRKEPARVVVVADRPASPRLFAQALTARGLPATAVEPAAAVAAEEWLVVLVAERWTCRTALLMERLLVAGKEVAVLCPMTVDSALTLLILQMGATEAYPDDERWLAVVVLKLQRLLDRQSVSRWLFMGSGFEEEAAFLLGLDHRGDPISTEAQSMLRFCLRQLATPVYALPADSPGNALAINGGLVLNHSLHQQR